MRNSLSLSLSTRSFLILLTLVFHVSIIVSSLPPPPPCCHHPSPPNFRPPPTPPHRRQGRNKFVLIKTCVVPSVKSGFSPPPVESSTGRAGVSWEVGTWEDGISRKSPSPSHPLQNRGEKETGGEGTSVAVSPMQGSVRH